MTWGKLDDGFWRHPKVKAAARHDYGAVGLLVLAISLASEYETDGKLRWYDLEALCPNRRLRRKLVGILVECGLFEDHGEDGVAIHDYLEYNPSRAQLAAERNGTAKRVRRHRTGGRRPGQAFGGGEAQAA